MVCGSLLTAVVTTTVVLADKLLSVSVPSLRLAVLSWPFTVTVAIVYPFSALMVSTTLLPSCTLNVVACPVMSVCP